MVENKKAFNWQQYQMSEEAVEVDLTVDGEVLTLSTKKMSSVKKQKLISSCYVYGKGTVGFDHEKYGREALKQVIVDAPWGPTNDLFLISLEDSPLTDALATLVPDAFKVIEDSEELKKD
jgi:hypothetical protein